MGFGAPEEVDGVDEAALLGFEVLGHQHHMLVGGGLRFFFVLVVGGGLPG